MFKEIHWPKKAGAPNNTKQGRLAWTNFPPEDHILRRKAKVWLNQKNSVGNSGLQAVIYCFATPHLGNGGSQAPSLPIQFYNTFKNHFEPRGQSTTIKWSNNVTKLRFYARTPICLPFKKFPQRCGSKHKLFCLIEEKNGIIHRIFPWYIGTFFQHIFPEE